MNIICSCIFLRSALIDLGLVENKSTLHVCIMDFSDVNGIYKEVNRKQSKLDIILYLSKRLYKYKRFFCMIFPNVIVVKNIYNLHNAISVKSCALNNRGILLNLTK